MGEKDASEQMINMFFICSSYTIAGSQKQIKGCGAYLSKGDVNAIEEKASRILAMISNDCW